MKKILIFIFICISFIIFAENKTIKIAAASNLSYVLEELKVNFNISNPDINIEITYGASGKLAAQIMQGASYDIFMSADMKYPTEIAKKGFAETNPVVYAKGKLIMFTVKKIDLTKGLKILKSNNINTISICNPDSAPYGAATIDALTNYKIINDIESKIIKAETVAQVVHQVLSAADIGFTAKSLIFSKELANYKEGINWIEVDPRLYKKIEQGIIMLKNKLDKPEVKAFYDYILSDKAKSIFVKYSYDF